MENKIKIVSNFLFSDIMLDKRTRLFTLGTLIVNLVFGLGKVVLGIFFKSLFFGVTGIYSIVLGFTKVYALNRYLAISKIEDNNEMINTEKKSLKSMSNFVLVTSILYFGLCILSVFVWVEKANYHLILALAIVTSAFTTLGFGVVGSIKATKNAPIMIKYIKLVNVASGFIAIALAQRALLAVEGVENAYIYNGIIGIIMSCLALGVTFYMRTHINVKKFIVYNLEK